MCLERSFGAELPCLFPVEHRPCVHAVHYSSCCAESAHRRFQAPLPIYVGVAEAAAIITASGLETRRPSTVSAWQASLKVCPRVQSDCLQLCCECAWLQMCGRCSRGQRFRGVTAQAVQA